MSQNTMTTICAGSSVDNGERSARRAGEEIRLLTCHFLERNLASVEVEDFFERRRDGSVVRMHFHERCHVIPPFADDR